ncbi:hypothetical protein Tco_0432342 [Tanacetum coccineum]
MCSFALTMSTAEPKTIKDAMASILMDKLRVCSRRGWTENEYSNGPTKGGGYIANQDDFVDPAHPEKVYRLRKALYGLKQAPRAWTSDLPIPKRCLNTRKSTSGGIQLLGDKLVSWMSKKQDCTAMSSTEAEYVTLSASCSQVENGIIELYFVRTEYQLADMFTKALPEDRFQYLVRRIGMRCLTPAELEVLANESA